MQQLTHLDTLILETNGIQGPIPDLPKSLTTLKLHQNYLTGKVPAFHEGLHTVWIHQNKLHGAIPPFFPGLKYFFADKNELTGNIPSIPPSLKGLGVSKNHLFGQIPRLPEQMTILDISGNKLYGKVSLKKPERLFIQETLITEIIVEDDTLLKHCNVTNSLVNLKEVSIDVPVCVELKEDKKVSKECPRLLRLLKKAKGTSSWTSYPNGDVLSQGNCCGDFPYAKEGVMCKEGHIVWIDWSNSGLNGKIEADEIYQFRGLYYLQLHSNQLSGSLHLSNPKFLYVQHNQFSEISVDNPGAMFAGCDISNNLVQTKDVSRLFNCRRANLLSSSATPQWPLLAVLLWSKF